MKWMTDEECQEWEAMLAEAHGDASNGGKATKAMASILRRLLLDAEQAGRRWAASVLDDATVDGLHAMLKKSLKSKSVVPVSYDGRVIGKPMRVGVRRKRADGTKQWQQALIHDLTWDELAEHLRMINEMIGGLLVNQAVARRLFTLREQFPQTAGPAEACSQLGMTVDEFLASEDAA